MEHDGILRQGADMKGLTLVLVLKMALLLSLVYTAALFGPLLILHYCILDFIRKGPFCALLGAVMLIWDLMLLLLTATICSGICAKTLNLKYSGEHSLDLRNQEVQKWLLSQIIYIPIAVILDLFHLYPLKSLHIRLFGGRIGRGVVIGGMVTDPALLEVGDHSVIGGFSVILGHAVERGRIKFGKVKIGQYCGVGTRATVLAGSVLEDSSVLGAHSLLPKNSTIPAGKTFAGVPAKEIAAKHH
jgi:acetyltransferase-like isoleucine patch superfamily enzyme